MKSKNIVFFNPVPSGVQPLTDSCFGFLRVTQAAIVVVRLQLIDYKETNYADQETSFKTA